MMSARNQTPVCTTSSELPRRYSMGPRHSGRTRTEKGPKYCSSTSCQKAEKPLQLRAPTPRGHSDLPTQSHPPNHGACEAAWNPHLAPSAALDTWPVVAAHRTRPKPILRGCQLLCPQALPVSGCYGTSHLSVWIWSVLSSISIFLLRGRQGRTRRQRSH